MLRVVKCEQISPSCVEVGDAALEAVFSQEQSAACVGYGAAAAVRLTMVFIIDNHLNPVWKHTYITCLSIGGATSPDISFLPCIKRSRPHFFYIPTQKFSLPSSCVRLSHGHIMPHVIVILLVWFPRVSVGAADHVSIFQDNVNLVFLKNMGRAALKPDYSEIWWRCCKKETLRLTCSLSCRMTPWLCEVLNPRETSTWSLRLKSVRSADSELPGLNSARRVTWTVAGWCQWAKFGSKGAQHRNDRSYQGFCGTAFADAHLLDRNYLWVERQFIHTSFKWLHGNVMSDGRRMKWKLLRWPVMWLCYCFFQWENESTSLSALVGLRRSRTLWTHSRCISPQLRLILLCFAALRFFAEYRRLKAPPLFPSESDDRSVKKGQYNRIQAKLEVKFNDEGTSEQRHLPGTFWCCLKLELRANCHEGKSSPFPWWQWSSRSVVHIKYSAHSHSCSHTGPFLIPCEKNDLPQQQCTEPGRFLSGNGA